MRLTTNHARNTSIAALFVFSTLIFLQGCNSHHPQKLTFASHKVTLTRDGITNRFGVEERGTLAVFHYDGYCFSGDRLKVTIENDKVTVNDKLAGMLKQGDSIRITDDGITVNSLDHGQTEKYLQANISPAPDQTASK
ncbi:MAG: hypothetical protein H7Y30_00445 [Pyrinomonadaceae bacterium]|nr:hypothetical protein [Pyrinomonadaceae bacterium]